MKKTLLILLCAVVVVFAFAAIGLAATASNDAGPPQMQSAASVDTQTAGSSAGAKMSVPDIEGFEGMEIRQARGAPQGMLGATLTPAYAIVRYTELMLSSRSSS